MCRSCLINLVYFKLNWAKKYLLWKNWNFANLSIDSININFLINTYIMNFILTHIILEELQENSCYDSTSKVKKKILVKIGCQKHSVQVWVIFYHVCRKYLLLFFVLHYWFIHFCKCFLFSKWSICWSIGNTISFTLIIHVSQNSVYCTSCDARIARTVIWLKWFVFGNS